MRKIRENVIVAKGNQAVFASGQSVFRSDGTTNVKPGQLVVWNPKTNLSLGNTITCATNDLIVISQGTKNGKLRSCFGDVIYGCDVKAINAEGPNCGTADIWDFYIDNNISCNSTFSVTITVKDDDSLNTYPWNKPETYTYSVDTKDCACTDCETGFDAKKLACLIVDQINNNGYNTLPVTSKAYFKKIPNSTTKFTAHVLHGGIASNVVYCISTVAGCGDCLDANVLISSMKFNTDTVVVFDGLDNADGDATLMSRLDSLVRQINEALGDNGSAAITGGSGSCCSLRLEINSCFPDLLLYSDAGATAAITPCVTANDPFDPQAITGDCTDCAISATALLTFTDQPTNTETVTIGAKTYTFQDTLTNVNGNVKIGASLSATISNLIAAVNLGSGSGTAYAAAMTLHPTASAFADIPNTVRFLAKTPGAAGNALVSTETITDASFGAATFEGGVDGDTTAYKTYSAGFRIIANRSELVCNPLAPVPNPVSGTGLRQLQVFPTRGFDCGKSKIVHFQEATPPDNLGYHWQWVDFASANGGVGRGHEPFVRQGYGPLGLPLGRGPEGAVEPVCKETYCSYAIEHSIPYRDQTVYGTQVHPRGTTIVLIPSGDTTTRTEFEAIINNYFPSCDCPIKTSVSCA